MLRLGVKLAFIFCFLLQLPAQDRYWVGVSDDFIEKNYSLTPFYCSEWLQLCSYELTPPQIKELRSKGIMVSRVRSFKKKRVAKENELLLSFALEQVNADTLISLGLSGKNVKIGIIDGGFLNADSVPSLSAIFQSGNVKAYRDFITPELKEYGGSAYLDDTHGTEVMQLIGGYNHEKNIRFGLASESEYYLARTDHGGYEKRQEEDLLIKALEWMQKEGVKLVNISLGYTKEYTDPGENYAPEDMNGKTSQIARAVDTAFYKKNMLVVVAAGNEGNDPEWRVLSTPGDAKGALTVGATKLKYQEKLDYSSIGPDHLGYLKPEVSCFASQGTSYSTPIITGIAAGIMQYDPTLKASEIKKIIQESGSLYPHGNNYVGYGIPDCKKILLLLSGKELTHIPTLIAGSKKLKISSEDHSYIAVYHKKGINVIHREVYRPEKSKLKISKYAEADQSTVFLKDKCFEIVWE